MRNRLKEILIKVKKRVFTVNLGNTISSFKGNGLDFSEIKDYVVGDDVRSINWKSTAKGMGVKVNLFNEDRELNILLVFMVSGTINFGTKRIKQDVMSEIMAFLAYLALKNNDNQATLFFDEKPINFYKPTKKFGILEDTLEFALTLNALSRRTNYKKLCNYINSKKRKRSLIFIIGDFYGDVDLSEISAKNEVYALIVRDRFEENPDFLGEISLADSISLEARNISVDSRSISKFKKEIVEHDKRIYGHFLEHKIKFKKIYTDDDIYHKVSEITKG